MKTYCPDCGYKFAREAAYFYGSYPVNLIAAEIIPMALLIFLLVSTNLSVFALEAITIPLAVGLPLLFYPFSCMLWMAFGLLITPIDQAREKAFRGTMRMNREQPGFAKG